MVSKMKNIMYILAYPLQEQIDVGHLDVLQVMFENALKIFDEVHIISPRDDRKYQLGKRIFVHSINTGLPRIPALFAEAREACKITKKNDVRLIRALAPHTSGVQAYLINKLTGIPYVLSVHADRRLIDSVQGVKRSQMVEGIIDRFENSALRNARLVPVISGFIKGYVVKRGISPKKIFDHPNFVNTGVFKPLRKSGKKKLVFVGRLEAVKGVDILIRAAPMIEKDVEILIAGTGPQEKELKELTLKLGVSKKIKFLESVGHEKELPKVLGSADIFVAPLTAGFSMIEALSCGLPIVAGDIEWAGEIVDETVGVLVKPGDSTEFAKAVNRMLKDKRLLMKMGKKAREKALETFDIEKWKERELEIYKRGLGWK